MLPPRVQACFGNPRSLPMNHVTGPASILGAEGKQVQNPSMGTLDEIQEIERLIENLKGIVRSEVLGYGQDDRLKLPIYKLSFGSTSPTAPVLMLVGGVHGLERIGAQVCISLLNSLSHLVLWDRNTQRVLEEVRIVFVPTVNPWGILKKRRSNPNGVDLMRNAPVTAVGKITPLVGGHRYSPLLPWYQGADPARMEHEAEVLVQSLERELAGGCQTCIAVDFHSGFGLQDRIWFPYAKTAEPFPDIALAHSFKELMDRTYPYHFYRMEPQSVNYTTHGDLWDYTYDRHRTAGRKAPFLPLCVEMGSWNWVKKNPFQFFSAIGPYNPVKKHRLRRTLRRHNTFFEFLIRAVSSPDAWAHMNEDQRLKHEARGLKLWYGREL